MSLVRLLGFATLPCGCVVGKYREVPSRREVIYVEEKGPRCADPTHRRNQTLRTGSAPPPAVKPAPVMARVS
jgi:hypothetical protein